MKIQVLGSGCQTCTKLHQIVTQVVKDMETNHTVEYISGPEGTLRIIELGAMSSPVLAINDQIAMTGFTSDTEKIKNIIQQAIE